MQRIYLPDTPLVPELIITQKELYHQITRVMRARVWQKYIFFDGVTKQDHIYQIHSIDAQKVVFVLEETFQKSSEIFPNIHLYQALPHKLEKLEYIIGKWVEIGYRSFIFFPSERSQKLILNDIKKLRLQKIAIEAVEQCRGNIIPELYFLESNIIAQWDIDYLQELKITWDMKNIFCHTQSQGIWKLSELQVRQDENICIYIGPEGWFTSREIGVMQEKWFIWVNFWSRILRCETVSSVLWFYLSQKKED